MTMPTIEDLAADIARLRRENVELRTRMETLHSGPVRGGWRRGLPTVLTSMLAVAGLVALTGASATAGPPTGQSFTAPFTVKNASGQPILRVNNDNNGGYLQLFQNSKPIVELGENMSGTGGYLRLASNAAVHEVALGSTADGGAVIVYDLAGHPRGRIGFNSAGKSAIEITNASGTVLAQLAQHDSGGYLALDNPSGYTRVEAGTTVGGAGTVLAFDSNNEDNGHIGGK